MEKLGKETALAPWLLYLYRVLFLTLPWSFEYGLGNWQMRLPSEPLIGAISIALLGFLLFASKETRKTRWVPVLSSPLFVLSLAWLAWMLACSVCSTMPLVSAKYMLVSMAHWWVFLLGIALWPSFFYKNFVYLLGSMTVFVVYAFVQHWGYAFRPDQANLSVMPFFPDNTLYSAVLAMLFLGGLHLLLPSNGRGTWKGIPFVVMLIGIFFSYCRAAWLSLMLVLFIAAVLFYFKKWWKIIAASSVLVVLSFYFTLTNTSNLADGNMPGIKSQLTSVVNWRTDVSNLERLNRYSCAHRMTKDRPIWGFGPGTFHFQYLPYQRPEEMTRISVTAPVLVRNGSTYGRGGGAHSEYWQAAAECGWPGLALWALLVFTVLFTAFKKMTQTVDSEKRLLYLCSLCSLSSYFLHGIVNNFLHDERVALLVLGQIGAMIGLENFYKFQEKTP